MNHSTEILSIVKRRTLGLTLVLGAASLAFAQQKADVSGRVSSKNGAVPYASVTFTNKANKLYSDAALSDENGNFSLQLVPGNYDVLVEGIDFKKATFNRQISGGNIGTFTLEPESIATNSKTVDIQAVTITAAAKPYKVEIDKKVYDPSTDIVSKGGNLQDVLQNVPSVSVDPDGTVCMRGSSNVKFLVNGKPSALLGIDDGANALQSIPADQIERVEVITNPSAKFDASGTAGILNIILKKSSKMGFNGSVTGTLGWLPRTSLNTNLNWKKGKWNWFVNGGGGYSENKVTNWADTRFTKPDSEGNIRKYQELGGKNYAKNYNATAGVVYDITNKTSVNLSGTVRRFEMENNQPVNYTYYPSAGAIYYGVRDSQGYNNNNGLQGDFGLDHKFDDKGQNISLAVSLQRNNSDASSLINQSTRNIFELADKSVQGTLNKSLVAKADYELPLGENSSFAAGYKMDRNNNNYDFAVSEKKAGGTDFIALPRYNNTTTYREFINAFYAQFKSKAGNFGYQLGLRDELSNINIDYKNNTGKENINKNKKYNGLFPSVFLSYDLGKNSQLLLNYSRRIDRPRSFFMVPFMSYSDNQNIFRGNPDLDPAYIDSFELGYSISNKKVTLNPTVYYRNEDNDVKMTVAYLYDPYLEKYVFNTMPMNLGYDRRIGFDLNFTYDPFSWLKLMGEADIYRYNTSGNYSYTYPDPATGANINKAISYDGKGFSTRLRLAGTFKIDKTFSVQMQGNYRGAQKEGANNQKAMYFVNLGASKTIWKGDGTITANMQDIFNTRARKVTVINDDYTVDRFMQWQPQQFSVSLTYRFKQGEKIEQKKPKRQMDNNQSSGEDQMPPM